MSVKSMKQGKFGNMQEAFEFRNLLINADKELIMQKVNKIILPG
jgi:hypothetical protein